MFYKKENLTICADGHAWRDYNALEALSESLVRRRGPSVRGTRSGSSADEREDTGAGAHFVQ